MSVNKSVQKLNTDLSRMNKALSGEKKAAAAEKKAVAAEKALQAKTAAQEKALIDGFISAPPTDPAALQKLLGQFVTLGQNSAQADGKLKAEISKDKAAVSKDAREAAKDKKVALKDLKPAEYHMGLKETNRDRKELGLKGLKKALQAPGVKQTVPGQVGKWIAEAQTILAQHGVPMSKMNARDIAIIIQHESSGNPNAINNWDSNAAAGHPSEGLMQTIGPTFNAYKLPGHGQILNPIDNIIAGVRYAISRYGSISNVPGVVDVHAGRPYVGY